MDKTYTMNTRISSFEVGPNRKLKPCSMLMLMQETAGRHLQTDGLSYERMRSTGIVFLLVKQAVKIYSAPGCGEEISIKTWFESNEGVQFLRAMQFFDKSGEKLIEAQTHWIIADPDTHRILRPNAFPFEMPCFCDKVEFDGRRIKVPDDAVEAGIRQVRYSDIDCNNHMNNAVYADIISDYYPGGLENKQLREFQINFEGEAVLGDKICLRTAMENGAAVYEGKVNGHKCFTGYAVAG